MLTVDKCDILWTVAKSQQTITMKVCIEPQPLIIGSNISDLNISSLQNYSYTLPNTTSLNIPANTSNISRPILSNISNTSLNTNISANTSFNISANTSNTSLNTNISANTSFNISANISNTFSNTNTSNISRPILSNISNTSLNTYTPSPSSSVIDDIQVVLPTDVTPVAPSPRLIRGSPTINTPSPQINLTSLSPSSVVDNTAGYIFIILVCLVLVALVVSFIRLIKNQNPKCDKYSTNSVAPERSIARRPKDYAIEYYCSEEQKTKRQLPHPPKEETEDHDTDDTPPSE